MPKTKFLAKYPSDYFTLFETAVQCNGFTVPCLTVKQAKALRFDLYSFLKAADLEEVPSVRDWRAFSLCVQNEPPALRFIRPEGTALGNLVAAALHDFSPDDPELDIPAEDEASDTLQDLGFSSPNSGGNSN